MKTTVVLIGAGGKMGTRITNNLAELDAYEMLYCEKSELEIEKLESHGLKVSPTQDAVAVADIAILAVPDALIRVVSADVVPSMKGGSTVLLLDPAAAMAKEVALRDDLNYVVCHPCHPPLFGDEESPKARKDFFGGIAAKQDVVLALIQGTEEACQRAESLCRDMFAPVVNVHRITVEQMAILEPAMAEVCAATAAVIMTEALEEAVKAGVPREAATAFMMGHAQIALAIVFGAIDSPFSDAAKIAIRFGRKHLLKENWGKVFQIDRVKACIQEMLHHGEQE